MRSRVQYIYLHTASVYLLKGESHEWNQARRSVLCRPVPHRRQWSGWIPSCFGDSEWPRQGYAWSPAWFQVLQVRLHTSCGVPMKMIQDWLGHSDMVTTANIYSHLDASSKIASAVTIWNALTISNEGWATESCKNYFTQQTFSHISIRNKFLAEKRLSQ